MSWTGVITNVGRDLLARYVSGGVSITVNRATVGSGIVAEELMRSATNLVSYKDEVSIVSKTEIEDGVDFGLQIGPRAAGSYKAKEIGLWANATGEEAVLLALFQNADGIDVPARTTNPDFVYIINAALLVNNIENLNVTIDTSAYVTMATFNECCERVTLALDNKVDKVAGKGLSDENFTAEEKAKLAGIAEQANKYTLPTASSSTLGGVKVGDGLGISSGVLSNSGVRSVATGSANGTVSVNTNGTAADVPVKGLGSAAYKSEDTFALAAHNHNASAINEGTLPVARGGTGVTSNPSMLTDLASTTAADVFAASPRPGVTGTLPVARGGTGITSNPSMKVNLASTSAANVFAASPRPGVDGTLPAANGGTGNTSLKAAGSAIVNALDAATSVAQADDYIVAQHAGGGTTTTTYYRRALKNIRVGGLLTGRKLKVALASTTDVTFDGTADQTSIPVSGTLPIANGGTGKTTASEARAALGAAASSHNHSAANITSGTLAIARGGTGVTANPSMLTNLASTTAADVFAASPRPGVTGKLPIANGGTNADTAAGARTNLGIPTGVTGLPKTMETFAGNGDWARTFTLGYKPSCVMLFCFRTGNADAEGGTSSVGASFAEGGGVMAFKPGLNVVPDTYKSYITTTNYTTFYNNLLATGKGGAIITDTGFVIGHASGYNKGRCDLINAVDWQYMYWAFA